MKKLIFLSILFLILLVLSLTYKIPLSITGFNAADVSIKYTNRGNITYFDYQPLVNLTNTQNISIEFVNTGSTTYTARIEVTIYIYNITSMKLASLAEYYDATVNLTPGDRRFFGTLFMPNQIGTYYIKVRVPYDARVTEVWGSFFVIYYQTAPPTPVIVVPVPVGGGGVTYVSPTIGITRLVLDYPQKFNLYAGQKMLLNVTAKNIGTVNLHNLKFYASTTNAIGFEVNPKIMYELKDNESSIFLISLNIPTDISSGIYPFDFQVVGSEVKESGSISLNISSEAIPIEEDIEGRILNYEYLISELDREILAASLKGLNVTLPEMYLDNAKNNLEKAKEYYREGRLEDAKNKLDEVKKDLENVVFELANISFKVYIAPAFSPFLILILIVAIVLGILFYVYQKRKKREERPKILKAFTESET